MGRLTRYHVLDPSLLPLLVCLSLLSRTQLLVSFINNETVRLDHLLTFILLLFCGIYWWFILAFESNQHFLTHSRNLRTRILIFLGSECFLFFRFFWGFFHSEIHTDTLTDNLISNNCSNLDTFRVPLLNTILLFK